MELPRRSRWAEQPPILSGLLLIAGVAACGASVWLARVDLARA